MDPYAAHANDISKLQAEAKNACPKVSILNRDWLVLPGTAMKNKPLRDGGFSQVYDFSFITTVGQFLSVTITDAKSLSDALMNQRMVYLNDHYKIVKVNILAGGTLIQVAANSLHQNS